MEPNFLKKLYKSVAVTVGANQHFHNLARWQGRTYQSKHVQNPLPVRDIVDTVIKAVEAIDINSY